MTRVNKKGRVSVRIVRTIDDIFKYVTVDENGCWLWSGTWVGKGYGQAYYKHKPYRAHRLAYLLKYGPFDPKLLVCHKCDNRRCVNPEHLFLGTCRDNNRDTVAKGRHVSPLTKLTEDAVRQIRKLAGIETLHEIAARFGVTHAAINAVLKKITWKHVED